MPPASPWQHTAEITSGANELLWAPLPRNDPSHNSEGNMTNDRLTFRDLTGAVIFLSQTVVGVLGNLSLLHQLFLHLPGCRPRSTDLLLKHVVLSNSLVILSEGVPQMTSALGWKHFTDDLGCKLLLYVQRVGRGMSISTTCLLSVFQAITISPVSSCWKTRKTKCPKCIGILILLCWVLCLLVNILFPYLLYVSSKWSSKNLTRERDFGYCSAKGHDRTTNILYVALIVLPELLFSMLIIWASSAMVLFLYRHRQRVRHLHRTSVHPRSSPEARATQSILVLASSFVAFHAVSSIMHVCVAHFYNPSWWLVNITTFLAVCFPTVSPFLLMSCDCSVSRLCFVWVKLRRCPNLTGNL